MNKAVMRSAKPYWIYLILTGKKTVEVGKDFPKSKDWNRIVEMYCSKDMRSFNRIPKEDREWMRKYLGKVACKFVCDTITALKHDTDSSVEPPQNGYFFVETPPKHVLLDFDLCLTNKELIDYGKGKLLYGWHISDLVIYDKPRELGDYYKVGKHAACAKGERTCDRLRYTDFCRTCKFQIRRPPQSWQYIEV